MARVRQQQDFIDAALVILGNEGPDGLTIAALCRALGVTKGSFYHHFDGMPAFTSVFLEWCEVGVATRLGRLREEPDLVAQLQRAFEYVLDINHAAEAAVRAWGRSNDEVARVVERVDRAREEYLAGAFVEYGCSTEDARYFSRLMTTTLVGAQHRGRRFDDDDFRSLMGRQRRMVADAAARSAARLGSIVAVLG